MSVSGRQRKAENLQTWVGSWVREEDTMQDKLLYRTTGQFECGLHLITAGLDQAKPSDLEHCFLVMYETFHDPRKNTDSFRGNQSKVNCSIIVFIQLVVSVEE